MKKEPLSEKHRKQLLFFLPYFHQRLQQGIACVSYPVLPLKVSSQRVLKAVAADCCGWDEEEVGASSLSLPLSYLFFFSSALQWLRGHLGHWHWPLELPQQRQPTSQTHTLSILSILQCEVERNYCVCVCMCGTHTLRSQIK